MINEEKTRIDQKGEIENLKSELKEMQERERMTISQKVKKELKVHLEDAANQLILVEQERDQCKNKLTEHLYLLSEMDGMIMTFHKDSSENKKEINLQEEMIATLKKQGAELEKKHKLKEGEALEKDGQIVKLQKELEEMRGVIFKLNDVRTVLNRVMEPYSKK